MFEHIGYSKDYFIDGKYIGSMKCEKDRELMGYGGSKTEIVTDKITLENKRIIKAGTTVVTQLQTLCGKIIKPINQNINENI